MALEYEQLTGKIIAAGIEVHKELGPGFLEPLYENAIEVELRLRGIPFQRQLSVQISFKGVEVGMHRLDLFVFDQIVVELKATKNLKDIHFATVRSYLRAMDRDHGLLLNFAKTTLEIRRVTGKR